jgi:hypothetical protein
MADKFIDGGRSVTSKIVAFLMTFASGESYSLTEIARLTGLPVSTTHRLVTELLDWGMLQRSSTGRFCIGMQLRAIVSRAAVIPPHLHQRARRVMEDLAAVSAGGVVRLAVLQDLDVAYIRHLDLVVNAGGAGQPGDARRGGAGCQGRRLTTASLAWHGHSAQLHRWQMMRTVHSVRLW